MSYSSTYKMVTMPNILELPLLVSWLIQRQQKDHMTCLECLQYIYYHLNIRFVTNL